MRILFDQGTPVPLRAFLTGHEVVTAFECGWSALHNGDLLGAVEAAGFDAVITTDQNLRYQQNLSTRRLAIVVLLTTSWPKIKPHATWVGEAVMNLTMGTCLEPPFPPPQD
jgi:hypothetical protein